MSQPGRLDLTLQSNERFDRVLRLAAGGAPLGLDGWIATMVIYDGNEVVSSSASDTPDIVLTQYLDADDKGRVDLLLGQDLTGSLLVPFDGPPDYWYRFDLIDATDPTNIIPCLVGIVTIERRYGL
jgi:hypothetical protein